MATQILFGQGASPGIVIGPVYHLTLAPAILHYRVAGSKIDSETDRLLNAFLKVKQEWQKTDGVENFSILHSHFLILKDPLLLEQCRQHIQKDRVNAEWALELTEQDLSVTLAQKDPITSNKRREDIHAVVAKILGSLDKKEFLSELDTDKIKNHILVTDCLTPETVVFLHRFNALGFITETGGKDSHTMILARSLCLPAVCGVEKTRERLSNRQKIILNGFEGKIISTPSSAALQSARDLSKKHQLLEKLLQEQAQKPAFTRDKQRIRMEANIELPEEIPAVLKYGAEGIGLFRTESLFWNRDHPPSPSQQRRLYKKILQSAQGLPVTFRTFDISGEGWMNQTQNNPALGLRGIRFGLKEKNLLKNQIRALLSAAAHTARELRILLPMVSSLEEIEQFRALLKEEKKPDTPKISLGIMIEVPATAFIMDSFEKQVDFFAIGTNDLIQYTLAMDRTNEQLAANFSNTHPAVLRILFQVVQNALKLKKPVYLCGELAANPLFIPLLLGLGIRHFSMNPLSIPQAKKVIRSLSAKECGLWIKHLLLLKRSSEIEKELKKMRLRLDTPRLAR